jgi:positive regulator of sigma E activity
LFFGVKTIYYNKKIMACNSCKKNKNGEKVFNDIKNNVNQPNRPIGKKILDFSTRILLFITFLIFLTPLFIIGYLVALFKLTLLSKELNLVPVLYYIGTKFLKLDKDEDDDDEDDEDDFNEDEYEYMLENVDDIIEINKNK